MDLLRSILLALLLIPVFSPAQFISNDYLNAQPDAYIPSNSGGVGSAYNKLVWADEFDGIGNVDENKWHHQTQLPNGKSWYNNEVQHYTDRIDNSYQEKGALHVVLKKETYTDQGQTKEYTSARLNSKFAFTHGRVEVRAKLPTGVGTWPAVWMLGKNVKEPGAYWTDEHGTMGWPGCGEIDIIEHWGDNQDYIQSAMHNPASSGNTINKGGIKAADVSDTYHVYSLEWTENKMDFSIDGKVYYTYAPEVKDSRTWPYTGDQYLIINVAMAGEIDPEFRQSALFIDYVRVYQ